MLGELLIAAALAGPPSGWRHDGTGVFPAGASPSAWSEAGPYAWKATLPVWGNASPVVLDGRVCVTQEPTTLTCLSSRDGAVLWSHAHPVAAALQGADAERLRASLGTLARDQERQVALQQQASQLSRAARRGDEAAEAQLVAVSAELMALRKSLEAYADYLTPPDREQVGYASSTPATDGRALFALFGNGVLAAREPDGSLRWQRWLGALKKPVRGYGVGHGASPLLVDGVLIVPWEQLRGVDPATGAERWTGPVYADYGTPAVVRVDGVAYLVTPAGEVVRARDGQVVARHELPLYWASPTAVPGTSSVVFVGGAGKAHSGEVNNLAWRLDLTSSGGAVQIREAWRAPIATGERFYASAVVHGGRVYAIDDTGALWWFELATGRAGAPLRVAESHGFLPSLVVAGDLLFASSESGAVTVVRLGASPAVVGTSSAGPLRSTPAPVGGRVYLRTLAGVVAVGS